MAGRTKSQAGEGHEIRYDAEMIWPGILPRLSTVIEAVSF